MRLSMKIIFLMFVTTFLFTSVFADNFAINREITPPYIIGTESYCEQVLSHFRHWDWTKPTTQNCLTFAREVAAKLHINLPFGNKADCMFLPIPGVILDYLVVVYLATDAPGVVGPKLQ